MPGKGEGYEQDNFMKALNQIKTKEYSEALNIIAFHLGLGNDIPHAQIEALLIYAAKKRYPHKIECDVLLMSLGLLQEFSRRNEELKAEDDRSIYSTIREHFLQKTDYIQLKYRGKYHPYEEAKRCLVTTKSGNHKTEIDTIRSTIDSDSSKYIQELGKKLLKMKQDISSFLQVATTGIESSDQDFLSNDDLCPLQVVKICQDNSINLPEPTSVGVEIEEDQLRSQSGSHGYNEKEKDSSDEESTTRIIEIKRTDDSQGGTAPKSEDKIEEDVAGKAKSQNNSGGKFSKKTYHRKKWSQSFTQDNRKYINDNKSFFSFVTIKMDRRSNKGHGRSFGTMIVISFVIFALIVFQNNLRGLFEKETLIDNVFMVDKEISLFPGMKKEIKVAVFPNKANLELLEYYSQNPDVAFIENGGDVHFVVAPDGWQADAQHDTVISVQFRKATDTALVTIKAPVLIIPSDIKNPIGAGKNKTTGQGQWNEQEALS